MGSSPLTLGFVGGAPNSAVGYAHFVAARMDRLWRLEAGVFSRHEDVNARAAEMYGVGKQRTYSSLEDLLNGENERLDALAILTPTPVHADMVVQCLEAGLPVICEKALATTSREAETIRDACERTGVFLAVIYNYSGYPMVRELRRMIRDGDLGEILHFQAEMPQEGYLRTDDRGNKPVPQDWRLKDGPVPTLHLDLAVHLHELVHYLTGLKPREVVADQSSRGWFDVIDNASCLCRYTDNVQGQFWFSKCALGLRNGLRLRVYGSEASAEWYQLNPEEVILCRGDGRREIRDRASNARVASDRRYTRFKAGHPAGFVEALANLYADIHDALTCYKATGHQQSDEVFGAGLAVEGLQWLEAMIRSCESGAWEPVGNASISPA
jgi:predicted dehydrogenase